MMRVSRVLLHRPRARRHSCVPTGCPEDSACASIAGYCSSLQPAVQTSLEPDIQTESTPLTAAATVAIPSVTEVNVSQTQLSIVTGECTPTADRRGLEARQRPFPDYCLKVCHIASQEEMVVMNIRPVVGETDELISSMCKGKRAHAPIALFFD